MLEILKNAIDLSGLRLPYRRIDAMADECRREIDYVAADEWDDDGQLIVTNGVGWHVDPGFGPLTAMVVLRNDGFRVYSWGHGSVKPEPGDVVMLDVHKKHKAVGGDGIFVAVAIDFDYGFSIEVACNGLRYELELGHGYGR